jgi:protein-tyrosine phosphatase
MTTKRNVLFVCIGNTCRSPMAENIAKSLFKDDITFSSCGIKVISNKISQNAIQVIKDKLKIDLNK